jgi:trypsin-like peptidase
MRLCGSIGSMIVATALLAAPARAQVDPADDSLRLYAVHIDRTPKQPWPGYGIYVGQGLVITAAHVVGHAFWTRPKVEIAGQELPARTVKEGAFEKEDLTLLSVDEERLPASLRLRRLTTCQNAPQPGQDVIVVVPEETVHSRIVSPRMLPRDVLPKFATAIRDVEGTGNSGSGVFDARRKCLLGIMSRKIQRVQVEDKDGLPVKTLRDVAKYFVPASAIAEFVPPQFRF